MSKFRKKKKGLPTISTASLPDIVFMLLFFFMVSTKMRDQELLVEQRMPVASQLQKIAKKTLVNYVNIGRPKDGRFGEEPRIQVNDVFIEPREIPQFVEQAKADMPEYDREKIIISLRIDREARMGIVTDVKQQLREANALKINYSSNQGAVE